MIVDVETLESGDDDATVLVGGDVGYAVLREGRGVGIVVAIDALLAGREIVAEDADVGAYPQESAALGDGLDDGGTIGEVGVLVLSDCDLATLGRELADVDVGS